MKGNWCLLLWKIRGNFFEFPLWDAVDDQLLLRSATKEEKKNLFAIVSQEFHSLTDRMSYPKIYHQQFEKLIEEKRMLPKFRLVVATKHEVGD